MGQAAATVTVVLQDSNGMQTSRQFESRTAGITDAQAYALADQLQALTQLEVVDVQVSRRVSGYTATAAETNSSVAETASVRVPLAGGGFHTFNLPALKGALKSGSNVIGSNAALLAFLASFDDGGGAGASAGLFYVSDGEELDEAGIEAGNVQGKINR